MTLDTDDDSKRDEPVLTPAKPYRTDEPSRPGVVRLLPPSMTDAALVPLLRTDEQGAADLLFDRYGPYVERLVVRVIGVDPEVPDLINEVFARALAGIRSLRESSALKGWIGSIALFTARAFLRDRQTRRRWLSLFSPQELPEGIATVAPPEVTQALSRTYAVLKLLPENERIVFALRFIDQMDLAEIASISRVSLATVKRRLVRAQRFFADAARKDPLLREYALGEERRREP